MCKSMYYMWRMYENIRERLLTRLSMAMRLKCVSAAVADIVAGNQGHVDLVWPLVIIEVM